jgi:hypothetical protein
MPYHVAIKPMNNHAPTTHIPQRYLSCRPTYTAQTPRPALKFRAATVQYATVGQSQATRTDRRKGFPLRKEPTARAFFRFTPKPCKKHHALAARHTAPTVHGFTLSCRLFTYLSCSIYLSFRGYFWAEIWSCSLARCSLRLSVFFPRNGFARAHSNGLTGLAI